MTKILIAENARDQQQLLDIVVTDNSKKKNTFLECRENENNDYINVRYIANVL